MKPKSKLLRRSLLVLFLALIVVSMLKPRINPTEASPDATFSVVPSSVTGVEPPNSFSVDVYGYDLVDIYAWQVWMEWTPSVLDCTDVTFGDFLKDQPAGSTQVYNIQNGFGFVSVGETTTGEHPGKDAEVALLCTITFQVEIFGETDLDISGYKAGPPEMWLTYYQSYIDYPEKHVPITENGYFSNTGVTHDLTIGVDGSGTTSPSVGVHTFDEGTLVEVTAFPDGGWLLDHWTLDDGDVGSVNPYTVTMDADHALIAFFVEEVTPTFDLTIGVDGSGTTSPSVGVHTFDEGTLVEVTAFPDGGWLLDHWTLDDGDVGSANPYSVTMDSDHTLTAVFSEVTITYDLTISVVGSGTTVPSPGVYTLDEGTVRDVAAIPDGGWKLDYWTLDGVDVGSADPYTVTMDDDHTLTAYFVEVVVTFDLTIGVDGSGATSPSVGVHTFDEGTLVEVTAFPDGGWLLDHWTLDDGDVGSVNPYTVTMDADHALIAFFVEEVTPTFDLTIGVDGSGATSPSVGVHTYDEGTLVEVTAFPDGGWLLDHWTLDDGDVGSANPYSVTMDSDHTLTAVFSEIPGTVVYVDPSLVSANPTDSFTIDVNVQDVVDLYSYGVRVSFDGAVLEAVNIEEGPFLEAGGSTFFSSTIEFDNIYVVCAFLGAVPGVDGSGTLFNATFTVRKSGESDLTILPTPDSTLISSALESIPFTKSDGKFYTTLPVAKFTYSPHPTQHPGRPIVDETVTFNATASYDPDDPYDPTPGGIVSYEWDFDDGTPIVTESDPITTHVYDESGSFTVTLTVTDDDGETDIATVFIRIQLHDIAIIDVSVNATNVYVGDTVAINVTVLNEGSVMDAFNVTAYFDGNLIETIYGDRLSVDENTTITFLWDTTGLAGGTYTIRAEAYLVDPTTLESRPGEEIDLADNSFINGEVTIIVTYDLTISVDGSGTTDPAPGVHTYDAGTLVDVDAIPDSGWLLDHWTLDGGDVGSANPYTVTMDADHTLTAVFAEIPGTPPIASFTYSPIEPFVGETVTFNASESYDPDGTITGYSWNFGDGTTDTGMIVTHIYTAANTYTITLVVTDNDELSDTVTADVTIIEPPPPTHDLTIGVDGSGTTSPVPGVHTYDEDTPVEVTAFPDGGWLLDHWTLDDGDVGSANPYSVTMDSDHTLVAFFVEEVTPTFDLTIGVDGSGTTSPSVGVHTFDEGTLVEVTAFPDGGWLLDHWLLDGDNVGSANPYTVTMDSDHTLIAFFEEASFLTATVNIEPDTLNLKSKGKWVTCHITLPQGYEVSDIDVSTILLDGVISPKRTETLGNTLMVKFERAEVIEYIEDVLRITNSEVTLTVTGNLVQGTPFMGEDTIRVKSK